MSDPSAVTGAPSGNGGEEKAAYLRLPWYVVTAALVLVLGGALALGLYATRSSRGAPATAPSQPTVTAPAATAVPTPVSLSPTPLLASATTTSAPTPLAASAAATATSAPTAALAAPTGTSISLAATASPTPLPTVEPTLAAEVGAAYENFWRVTSQALLDLDDAHLSDVMEGDYLLNVSQRIEELRSEGRAIKTQVILNYNVTRVDGDTANVLDDFEDDSLYVRIGTDDPASASTNDHEHVLYILRNSSGVWKVADSVRFTS